MIGFLQSNAPALDTGASCEDDAPKAIQVTARLDTRKPTVPVVRRT